jgi:hypothetical protein
MESFSNLEELYKLMFDATQDAIEYVCDKILTELNLQMAQKNIGMGGVVYEPTGEFYEAWQQGVTERVGKYIQTVVGYEADTVHSIPDEFIHGSNYWSGGNDVSDILPDLIFGGKSGDFFGQGFWTEERDAWTPTIQRIDKSFDKWLKEGFKQAGVSIT